MHNSEKVWHRARNCKSNWGLVSSIPSQNAVLIGYEISNWLSIQLGVRQGCILSSTMFNAFLDYIITAAFDGFEGTVGTGSWPITNLRFADDTDLMAGKAEELIDLTSRLESATRFGRQINRHKPVMRMRINKDVAATIGGKYGKWWHSWNTFAWSDYYRWCCCSDIVTGKAEAHLER